MSYVTELEEQNEQLKEKLAKTESMLPRWAVATGGFHFYILGRIILAHVIDTSESPSVIINKFSKYRFTTRIITGGDDNIDKLDDESKDFSSIEDAKKYIESAFFGEKE